MRLVVIVLFVAGCLEPPVPCEDGWICPLDQICLPAGGGCALPEQVDACRGLPENEPCSFAGTSGTCQGGACVGTLCGNGRLDDDEVCDDGNTASGDGCRRDCLRVEACGNDVIDDGEGCDDGNNDPGDGCGAGCEIEACGNEVIDPGEVCDDGNNTAGDDCSPDCRSDESCPNGRIDPVNDELCDDGDLASHDGCDTACLLEIPTWRELTPEIPTGGRAGVAMAYDAARGRVVRFGGIDGVAHADTFEWTGSGWIDVTPVSGSPPAQSGAAAAYDAARQRVVLFVNGLTWEWDGAAWSDVTPSTGSPPSRFGAAMAFDAARGRSVLFGGLDAAVALRADTWEWDGVAWTDVTPTTGSPPARTNHGLAYDVARGQIVLHGGSIADPSNPPFGLMSADDTWVWNGATWDEVTPASPPPARPDAALAYDAARARVVLFSGDTSLGDTWEWDGTTWIEDTVGVAPDPREQHAMVYDAARARLVMFGGDDPNPDMLGDTWERTGLDWIVPAPPAAPSGRFAVSAFDAMRGVLVVHGGIGASGLVAETWEWDGAGWRDATPASGPLPPAFGGRLVHDAARGGVVLFDATAKTWTWDGAAWNDVTPAMDNPPPGAWSAVFDEARAVIVLYTGTDPPGNTWEWNGTAWDDVTPAGGSPPARSGMALGYDAARSRVVMFGGRGEGLLADTWEWDGAAWTEQTPAVSPLPRSLAELSYDRARARIVLFGGDGGDGVVNFLWFGDTWEWDGATWHEVSTAIAPTARITAFTYDPVRATSVLFGGSACNDTSCAYHGDVWGFRHERAGARSEACTDVDTDGDGAIACDDPDCAGVCAACGDAICAAFETCRSCAGDCGACAVTCGDFACDPPETSSTCAADCP